MIHTNERPRAGEAYLAAIAGDHLWLCPAHYAEFNPAMPKLS